MKIPDFARTIEIIGDSLSAGQYATYEGLSSYSYGLGAALGNTEYSITAYPGICLFDKQCYGNLRGQSYQWFHTSDTSGRAIDIWGDEPEVWDFSKRKAADVVVVNLGTNDAATVNNVTGEELVEAYVSFVEGIRGVWPGAEIILVVSTKLLFLSFLGGTRVMDSTIIHIGSRVSISYHTGKVPRYLPSWYAEIMKVHTCTS